MPAAARAGRAALRLLPLALATLAAADHGVPIQIQLWDTGRTPLAHMVDVTNEFGLKVLAEHSFLNENNIAFSPYGLMGILVALYEGVDGESSYQIQRALQLPWNRNVMRIGFRDIHRTLKTYFIPEEGFLAGLALNNENVTFNESYKKILRFYGFDLDSDQLPSFPGINNTSESPTPSRGDGTGAGAATTVGMAPEGTEGTEGTVGTVGREETSTASRREETTSTDTNAETFQDIDVRMPSSKPTTGNPELSNAESTVTNKLTVSAASTTVETVRSTLPLVETETATVETTESLQSTLTEITTSSFPSSPIEVTTTNLLTSANAAVDESVLSTASGVPTTDVFSVEQLTRDIPDTPATMPVSGTEPTEQPSAAPDANFTAENSAPGNGQSTVKPLERKKKSIVNLIFKSPPFIDEDVMYRAFEVPPLSNGGVGGDKMFLANGLKNVQVSYMRYEGVLEHAFLPHLEAAALRLPLDSARYYLLALLPARAHALPRLLARLAARSDLRDVYAALRPRRVHATIPTFTVKGHVILTADLQKLGIREVFEPRQHDFSPLTPQPGVYVRSVEQAVSVTIREYAAAERNTSRYADRPPVFFSATYPFLYFVMDANIHVALMAGKVADPLNSRIL